MKLAMKRQKLTTHQSAEAPGIVALDGLENQTEPANRWVAIGFALTSVGLTTWKKITSPTADPVK
jgi:hypothetical protein